MNEFDTFEKSLMLFRTYGCIGNENNMFWGFKALNAASGVVGGMMHPYDGLLINQTENGIGIFMLKQPGIPWVYKIQKMNILKDKYVFIPSSDIILVEIKNASPLNKKVKTVTIITKEGTNYIINVYVNDPNLPYHNEGFARFIEKYSKK